MKKYISKGEWFDKDTEAELIDDYRTGVGENCDSGLFRGLHDNMMDEEMCTFDEFDIIEEDDKLK